MMRKFYLLQFNCKQKHKRLSFSWRQHGFKKHFFVKKIHVSLKIPGRRLSTTSRIPQKRVIKCTSCISSCVSIQTGFTTNHSQIQWQEALWFLLCRLCCPLLQKTTFVWSLYQRQCYLMTHYATTSQFPRYMSPCWLMEPHETKS